MEEKRIRLYRAEKKPNSEGTFPNGLPDWIKQNLEYRQSEQARGRWFTDDLKEAKWYVKHEYPSGRIVFIDLPQHIANRYRVIRLKKDGGKTIGENPFAFSKHPEKEYFLPKDIADKKKKL